jgi:hypothetical protein
MTNVAAAGTDTSCGALSGLSGLDPAVLHRFIVGRDRTPQQIDPKDLGDPFAQIVLASGPPPTTADEVVARFKAVFPIGDPQAQERSFLVGEGSQIPAGDLDASARSVRFVVALGTGPVDLILSAFFAESTSVEVMAWDAQRTGFNFYRTSRDGAWVFGGNSRDALELDTDGKGPFESHTSGNLLMKELRFPWVHWHSEVADARVDPAVLDPLVAAHRWARTPDQGGTLVGAEVCETKVAIPAIERWTNARFAAMHAGTLPLRPTRVLRQVLTCPTVNFVTSKTKSREIASGSPADLPEAFFVDSVTLCGADGLGLDSPPALNVPAPAFQAVIDELEVHLDDGAGFTRDGDTFFPFLVPERAFEDVAVARAAVDVLYIDRLLAALLLVDLSSPVFSSDRADLLALVASDDAPASAAAFSEVMAERIRSGAPDRVKAQFLEVWDAGDGWRDVANARLHAYYDRLTERLADDATATFRDWFRVAESRRRHAADDLLMPIFEFPLLVSRCNIPDEQRFQLLADGTVSQTTVGP